jgi:O-antigen ligase
MSTTTHWSPAQIAPRFRRGAAVSQSLLWLGLVLGGLFAGLICVFLPWWLVLAFVGAVVYPLVLWFAPWAGFAIYCAALEVSPDLKISDAMTLASLVLLGLRFMTSRQRVVLPKRELQLLMAFMALVLLSVGLAFAVFHNTVPFVYRDGRAFMYWLWLPLLYSMASAQPQGSDKLVKVLIGMAVFVSVIALIQYLSGVQIVREGRVGSLDATGAGVDVTRVQMPGFTFVLLAVAWAVTNISLGGRRMVVGAPLLLLFVAAIYVNFGRGLWAWTVVAVLMCGVVLGWRRAALIYLGLGFVAAVALIGLYLIKPAVIDSAVQRVVSVADEGGNKTSFGWRKLENQTAVQRIIQSPLVGIGLGGEYRNWIYEVRNFTEHTRYVHNSYYFIALKVGLPALSLLLVLIARRWWLAFRRRHEFRRNGNAVAVAAVASVVALLGLSVTQPELVGPHTVVLLSLLLVVMINATRPAHAVVR